MNSSGNNTHLLCRRRKFQTHSTKANDCNDTAHTLQHRYTKRGQQSNARTPSIFRSLYGEHTAEAAAVAAHCRTAFDRSLARSHTQTCNVNAIHYCVTKNILHLVIGRCRRCLVLRQPSSLSHTNIY